jgi:type II secretory pathway predicted ATPase ExeA
MYRSFFKLRERPFDLTPNPRFLVLTPAHREALGHLDYGIASRKGITLLLGEAGTGKTTVIRSALDRQPDRVHAVHLHNPALTRDEFIEMLAARFGLSESARSSKAVLLLELEALLIERHAGGEATALIIDEAQSLPLDLLEEIRLLANIETADTKLLSVVLAGQPELAARLNDPALRQLKQRIALRCELRALTAAETLGYVAGRLVAAGGVGSQIFTREAVLSIHERAAGIPRVISVIADNALVSGFALAQRPVTRATVEEVCGDLDVRAAETAVDNAGPSMLTKTIPAGRNTVLAFEASAAADSTPQGPDSSHQKVNHAGSPPANERPPVDAPNVDLFSNMYSKRRRFFGFMRQR